MGTDKLREALYDAFAGESKEREDLMVKRQIIYERQRKSGRDPSEELVNEDLLNMDERERLRCLCRYLERELVGIEWKIAELPSMDGDDDAKRITEALEQLKFMMPSLLKVLKKQASELMW